MIKRNPKIKIIRILLSRKFIGIKTKVRIGIVFDRRTRLFSARKYFSTVEKSIKKIFNSSIDTIDSIHPSNINFSSIRVQETTDHLYRGAILYDSSGIPYCMEISKQNSEKPITIFHEAGHLIDIMGVGTPGQFESANAGGLFVHLLGLANSTPEIIKINNIIVSGTLLTGGKLLPLPPNTMGTLKYLIQPHEILARSYAQYIVEKSKSKKLHKMLRNRKKDSKFGEQWSIGNFKPLMQEWDNILNSIGWHVKK